MDKIENGLSKKNKLKGRKDIGRIFEGRQSVTSFPVRLVYGDMDSEGVPAVQAAFSVSKRHFKRAVDRNRVKRLLREAYRLDKREAEGCSRGIVFVYLTNKIAPFGQMREKVKNVLDKWEQRRGATPQNG